MRILTTITLLVVTLSSVDTAAGQFFSDSQLRRPWAIDLELPVYTQEPVNLRGWKLIDKAGNVFLLEGNVGPRKSLLVTIVASPAHNKDLRP